MSTVCLDNAFIKYSVVLGTEKKLVPNGFVSPYVGKHKKESAGLIPILLGFVINGVIYGATLMAVLWILRSSDIVAWNISWHKSFLLAVVINTLRTYDSVVYRKK